MFESILRAGQNTWTQLQGNAPEAWEGVKSSLSGAWVNLQNGYENHIKDRIPLECSDSCQKIFSEWASYAATGAIIGAGIGGGAGYIYNGQAKIVRGQLLDTNGFLKFFLGRKGEKRNPLYFDSGAMAWQGSVVGMAITTLLYAKVLVERVAFANDFDVA